MYDTYEPEKNLNDLSDLPDEVFLGMPIDRRWASRELLAAIGAHLAPLGKRGIMSTYHRQDVPVYVLHFPIQSWRLIWRSAFEQATGRNARCQLGAALAGLKHRLIPFWIWPILLIW